MATVLAAQVAIAGSSVVDLPRAGNGVDYQLYVHVPPACEAEDVRCPVVYTLDADYSFALAAQIIGHLADRGQLQPLVTVAVGYADKSRYRQNRTRDYTPSFVASGGYGAEVQELSGGGPEFLRVLRDEIIPFVEARYAVRTGDRTLVGHSYGGLFAAWTTTAAPGLFGNYIMVSPSLWYDNGAQLAAMQRRRGAPGARLRVYIGVGEHEEQPQNGRAMVTGARAAAAAMRSWGEGVEVFDEVLAGETHASVFPAALSNGLRRLFGR